MSELVTKLLIDLQEGKEGSVEKLWPLLHNELRQIAASHMNGQAANHTLQATALVNEAFIKLVDVNFRGTCRSEFLALASQTMRSILVDHARRYSRTKRGKDPLQITLADFVSTDASAEEILLVDQLLTNLTAIDERMGKVVELKVFGGLTFNEIAAVLNFSSATVRADMRFGLAWLRKEMEQADLD